MQIPNDRSIRQLTTHDEHDDLLRCRMAMLGLDPQAVKRGYSKMFDKLKQQCTSCSSWEACAVDLKRDPTNPVWEAYCPNAGVLNVLVEITEVTTIN